MVVILIAAFLLAMNAATADGGRALYGIARDHMTTSRPTTSTAGASPHAR